MRRERFRRIWAVITVLAFGTIAIESASAHDKGCDGNPVPVKIKLDCCGGEEEHRLKPEQISRGANNEYIVSFEGYTFKQLDWQDTYNDIFCAKRAWDQRAERGYMKSIDQRASAT